MIIDVPSTWHPHLCQRTGNLSLTKCFVTFGAWWNPHDIRSEPMEGLIHQWITTPKVLKTCLLIRDKWMLTLTCRFVWKWGTYFFPTNLWPIITLPLKIAITSGLNAIFRSTLKYRTKFLGYTYSHSTIRNLPMTYTQFYQSNWWTSPKKSSPPKKRGGTLISCVCWAKCLVSTCSFRWSAPELLRWVEIAEISPKNQGMKHETRGTNYYDSCREKNGCGNVL